MLLYYPAATLLLPNLQYQDKTLDLKFDTSYIVAESQGKLIIAGVAAFFAKEKYILLQLGISFIVCLILAIITIFAKPCLVKSYNIWKAGGYCIAAWACGWAFLNIATQ